MGSSLSERITKNQLSKQVSDNSRNKVAFLALKDDVAAALADGWSMKAVWETLYMEEKISFSYKTFCVYVTRLIHAPLKPDMQKNTKEDEREKSKSHDEIRGFTFNPKPNLEELV